MLGINCAACVSQWLPCQTIEHVIRPCNLQVLFHALIDDCLLAQIPRAAVMPSPGLKSFL